MEGAGLAIALSAGLVGAYVADAAGLALIIGAYSAGLALSHTGLRTHLEHEIRVVYRVFVPIFFVVTGMLVDVGAMRSALAAGVLISLLAPVSKLVGCGGPALAVGFNLLGAARIGIGMLPRGEVALVVAGAGLAAGIVSQEVFAVAVFVAVATTLVAPPLLLPAFRATGTGLRTRPAVAPEERLESRRIEVALSAPAAHLLADAIHRHLIGPAGFETVVDVIAPHEQVAQYRRDGVIVGFQVRDRGDGTGVIHLEASGPGDVHAIVHRILGQARTAAAAELLGAPEAEDG